MGPAALRPSPGNVTGAISRTKVSSLLRSFRFLLALERKLVGLLARNADIAARALPPSRP